MTFCLYLFKLSLFFRFLTSIPKSNSLFYQTYNTCLILDNSAGKTTQEIKLEEFEMKEETVFIKEEILPGSTVEDTCTVYVQGAVYVQGEDMKMESKI